MQGPYGQEKSGKNCVFKDSQEKSGKFIETLRKSGKCQEFLSSMQIDSLDPNRQLYILHSFQYALFLLEKVVDKRAFFLS